MGSQVLRFYYATVAEEMRDSLISYLEALNTSPVVVEHLKR